MHHESATDVAPLSPRQARRAITAPLPAQVDALHALGFVPHLRVSSAGLLAGGTALSFAVRELMRSPEVAVHGFGRLRRTLMSGMPVTLALSDMGSGSTALTALEHVFGRINRVLSAHCIDRRMLGIAVRASDVPPPEFLRISRVLLGGGPRYACLGATQFAGSSAAAALWSSLYLQRTRALGIRPVYGGSVRTRCPLLNDEPAAAVLPQHALMVPPESAWLPVGFDLGQFADARGQLQYAALETCLRQALALADRLLDALHWPDALQRDDALQNRRVAIVLGGIGELAARTGGPDSHRCLHFLDRLLADMHGILWECSRALAERRGLLPALAEKDPSLKLPDDRHRKAWHSRWRAALATAAVRHRNLLVMSPYSVLPRNSADPNAHAQLLPLLAHADAVCFAGAPSLQRWTINEFKHFHQCAHAQIERRNAASFIAAGV